MRRNSFTPFIVAGAVALAVSGVVSSASSGRILRIAQFEGTPPAMQGTPPPGMTPGMGVGSQGAGQEKLGIIIHSDSTQGGIGTQGGTPGGMGMPGGMMEQMRQNFMNNGGPTGGTGPDFRNPNRGVNLPGTDKFGIILHAPSPQDRFRGNMMNQNPQNFMDNNYSGPQGTSGPGNYGNFTGGQDGNMMENMQRMFQRGDSGMGMMRGAGEQGQRGGMFGGSKGSAKMPLLDGWMKQMSVDGDADVADVAEMSEEELAAGQKIVTMIEKSQLSIESKWAKLEQALQTNGISNAERKKLMTQGAQVEKAAQQAALVCAKFEDVSGDYDDEDLDALVEKACSLNDKFGALIQDMVSYVSTSSKGSKK